MGGFTKFCRAFFAFAAHDVRSCEVLQSLIAASQFNLRTTTVYVSAQPQKLEHNKWYGTCAAPF
jgi:hypothetical protein